MSSPARIVVLGAHSKVAHALDEIAEERGLAFDFVRVTTTEHLTSNLDLIDESTLPDADLVVLAFQGTMARRFAEAAVHMGKPVLDLAGAFCVADGHPLVWPVLQGAKLGRLSGGRIYRLPLGLASPISGLMAALRVFQPQSLTVATYESAAIADGSGMDALFEQTRRTLRMEDPEPQCFKESLAFNWLPFPPTETSDPDWNRSFEQILREGWREALPGLEEGSILAARSVGPTFSVEGAAVFVDVALEASLEALADVVRSARGLRLVREGAPSAQQAVGRDDALIGGLHVEGRRLSAWIAADRMRRGSATMATLVLERHFESEASPRPPGA